MTAMLCKSIDGALTVIPLDHVDSVARSPYRGKNVQVTTKAGQEYHVERDWKIVTYENWEQAVDGLFQKQGGQGVQDTQSQPERPQGDGGVPTVPAGRQGQRRSKH